MRSLIAVLLLSSLISVAQQTAGSAAPSTTIGEKCAQAPSTAQVQKMMDLAGSKGSLQKEAADAGGKYMVSLRGQIEKDVQEELAKQGKTLGTPPKLPTSRPWRMLLSGARLVLPNPGQLAVTYWPVHHVFR